MARPGIKSISAAGSVARISAFSAAAPRNPKNESAEPSIRFAAWKQKASLDSWHCFFLLLLLQVFPTLDVPSRLYFPTIYELEIEIENDVTPLH